MATYYLNADTGNDSTGTGSSSAPWLTISKAHTSATSGDTIICQNSTAEYTWTTQSWTKSLTVTGVAEDGSGAVFNGAGLSFSWSFANALTMSFSKIKFRNAITTSSTTPLFGWSSSVTNLSLSFDQINFYRLKAAGETTFVRGGLLGQSSGTGNCGLTLTINECKFDDCSDGLNTGNEMIKIKLSAGGLTFTNNVVYFSTATNYYASIFHGSHSGADSGSGVTLTIKNNIVNNRTAQTITMMKNPSAYTYSLANNWLYLLTNNTGATNTNGSAVDPKQVDVANSDFHLRPDSTARGGGILI